MTPPTVQFIPAAAAGGPTLVIHDDFTIASTGLVIDNSTTRLPNTVDNGNEWRLHRSTDTTTEWSIGSIPSGTAPQTTKHLYVSENGSNNYDNEVVLDVGGSSYTIEAVFCPLISANAQTGLVLSSVGTGSTHFVRLDMNQQSGRILVRDNVASSVLDTLIASYSWDRTKFHYVTATISGTSIDSIEVYEGTDNTGTLIASTSSAVSMASSGTFCGFVAHASQESGPQASASLYDFKVYT
jgi:hypothetical protein